MQKSTWINITQQKKKEKKKKYSNDDCQRLGNLSPSIQSIYPSFPFRNSTNTSSFPCTVFSVGVITWSRRHHCDVIPKTLKTMTPAQLIGHLTLANSIHLSSRNNNTDLACSEKPGGKVEYINLCLWRYTLTGTLYNRQVTLGRLRCKTKGLYTTHQRWNSVKDLASRGILVVAYGRLSSYSVTGCWADVGILLVCVGVVGVGIRTYFHSLYFFTISVTAWPEMSRQLQKRTHFLRKVQILLKF